MSLSEISQNLNTIGSYIVDMDTTIQISGELLEKLKKRKMGSRESYENIIWDLLEDTMELSEQTKKDMEESRKEYKRGEVVSFEEIKKRMKNVQN